MSYPQFQAASDYLGAIADEDYVKALPSNSYEDRGGAVLAGTRSRHRMAGKRIARMIFFPKARTPFLFIPGLPAGLERRRHPGPRPYDPGHPGGRSGQAPLSGDTPPARR